VTPGSVGSLVADAEFEACCALLWPALLPGASSVPAGSAVSMAFAEAEGDGGEWPWPGVTPGSVGSLVADAEFEACCALLWPALLPGASSVPASSAVSMAFAEAEGDGGEWPWPGATPGSVHSGAADTRAKAECEACCELPRPALLSDGSLSSIDYTCTGAVTVSLLLATVA
jgi:hypothetical protein